MTSLSFNPWASLPLQSGGTGFSVENIHKMWRFGITKNDVPYLQSLVQQNLFPDESMGKNLVSFVIRKEADKVLVWLLHAQEFQNQVPQKETIKALQKVIVKILDLDWNTEIEPREKVLFRMMDHMAPYLLGKTPFQNNKGDTLPALLWDSNPYMPSEKAWCAWLLKPEVIPALLQPNKKGKTFFDKAKEGAEEIYRGSARDIEYYVGCVNELEFSARKKLLEKLPEAKKSPSPTRI